MIKIPEGLSGKELFAFLLKNKSALIAQKCSFPAKSDPLGFPYSVTKKTKIGATKAGEVDLSIPESDELEVTAIGNAANFIDCQMDMLLPDCWKKTIKESGPAGKNRIYHLKNHLQNTDGVIGHINKLYSKDYTLEELGLTGFTGTTQCLVMESTVEQMLDKKCFNLYSKKQINQHSIGLQYVKMDLAVNDPNYPAEFEIWNKYFMHVINKELANNRGYFWVVYEIKLLEVSAVLWGANELTPCIGNEEKEEEIEEENTVSVSEMIKNTKVKIAL